MLRNDKVVDYTVSESGHLARCHYAEKGAKTYTVMRGRAEAVSNGRKFVLAEGDIFNAEAWHPFSIKLLTDDTVVREISVWEGEKERFMPDPASCVDAGLDDILEAAPKGKGIYEFKAKGITLTLKVGRWQLDGLKEIWECRIDKGYRLAFNGLSGIEGLFMVRSGCFRVVVDGKETIASDGELIRVPAGVAYAFTALSEGCVIQDFHVSCHLFRMLEMVEAAQDYFPEKLSDQAYLDYLFEANKVVSFDSLEMEEIE